MAKAILKTTTKITMTHDRVAISIKYPNGEVLKTACNRGSDTMSSSRPSTMTNQLNLKPLCQFVCKSLPKELHGERFARLQKFFDQTNSIQDAIDQALKA